MEQKEEMETTPDKNTPSKKPRKRKKQMYNEIRQQMEFYFSDANLSKDRYLKKLIADDPGRIFYF